MKKKYMTVSLTVASLSLDDVLLYSVTPSEEGLELPILSRMKDDLANDGLSELPTEATD